MPVFSNNEQCFPGFSFLWKTKIVGYFSLFSQEIEILDIVTLIFALQDFVYLRKKIIFTFLDSNEAITLQHCYSSPK